MSLSAWDAMDGSTVGGQHADGPTTIDTYTGVSVDLLAPQPGQIRLLDIAVGLSHCCRFAGQTEGFYSVAEHSVICLQAFEALYPETALHLSQFVLLHDACEAYLGDGTAPYKRAIAQVAGVPAVKELEKRFDLAIMAHFGIPTPTRNWQVIIKEIDIRVRYAEGAVVKPSEQTWQVPERGQLPAGVRAPSGMEWRAAQVLFLNAARRLKLDR